MNVPSEHLLQLKNELPAGVTLVAVSKFQPLQAILEAYGAGQRLLGESRAQELKSKQAQLPADIQWHFIGHLQLNKVKLIAPYVALIQSIDSYRLLEEVNRQAQKNGRIIACLLQLHLAREESKFGFTPQACREMLASGRWKELTHIHLQGVMGMATNSEDSELIRSEFCSLHNFFLQVKQEFFPGDASFSICSMGMSDDYPIAIAAGSNMVRIGSKIFGNR
ncbi:MAG: YggS family pyridoxal phosphate-dependent enzyme [Prevotellaceae bacterium]|jgi:pyridoxal phosphate enzyme (YggS family)|nr:YggS family pyridoxal phosphate-dependent enzyme [Prevotellaceae bacterium]